MAVYTKQIEQRKADKWKVVQKARSVLDRVEREKRALTAEERSELDNMNSAIDEHETRILDLEKLNQDDPEEKEGDEPESVVEAEDKEGQRKRYSRPIDLEKRDKGHGNGRPNSTKEYRKAYEHFLKTGEKRDVIMGTQASGGYLVAPVQTSEDIVKQIDNLVFVRSLARIYKVMNAQALGVRQMTTRVSDADWTTEIASLTADASLAFSRRDLNPTMLTKLVNVSIRMMESGIDVEPIVNEELAYKFGISQEKGFLVGTGSSQPLGVFTASANGVPTSQDVTSGASADFVADDLIKMKYALKQPYFTDGKAAWVMGRSIIQEVRTFKDSYGQYLWRAGLASDKPDTILDVPVWISEYAPVVKTAGSYIAVLGNFGYYAIAEVMDFRIQRLVERFADTNEVGFLARWFIDGSPVLGEAFARLKTAA